MRATEILLVVVVIGVFAYLTISGSQQFDAIYPDNPINTTEFSGYNQVEDIRSDADDIYKNFQTLGAEDTSWFQKIGAGIVAIPYAVIKMPLMVVTAVGALTAFITDGLGGKVPYPIILASITILIIYAVREFLQFFQRSRS